MIGTPGASNALVIAQRLGMPKGVLSQARSLLDTEADGTSELINQIQATREDAERKRADAQAMLDDAKQTRARVVKRLTRVRDEGRRLKQQADREIDDSMQAVRRVTEAFAAEMHNAPQTWSRKAEDLAAQIAQLTASTPLAVRQEKFIESLRRGDSVYVVPFKREGHVERIRRSRRTLVVFVGNKQVEVPFKDVSKAERP
jgi:DNA mismatch repair protein MutS2